MIQKKSLYCRWGKRLLDLSLALPVLFVMSPIIGMTALLVRLKIGSPVLFIQQRPGLQGKPFPIYKLRTMTDERDAKGALLRDEKRLTEFGKFLRSTSLDELPELINILKGEMSLVGPRPLLTRYLDRYSLEQMRRHEVKPGITGWAQVNGRNALKWEEKFRLDVWYVDNYSLWLDVKILMRTLAKVIKRDNINSPECATMQEFMGNPEVPSR